MLGNLPCLAFPVRDLKAKLCFLFQGASVTLTSPVVGGELEQRGDVIEVWEADLLPQPGSKAPFNPEMNSEGRGCTSSEMRLNILLKHTFSFFFSFLF